MRPVPLKRAGWVGHLRLHRLRTQCHTRLPCQPLHKNLVTKCLSNIAYPGQLQAMMPQPGPRTVATRHDAPSPCPAKHAHMRSSACGGILQDIFTTAAEHLDMIAHLPLCFAQSFVHLACHLRSDLLLIPASLLLESKVSSKPSTPQWQVTNTRGLRLPKHFLPSTLSSMNH